MSKSSDISSLVMCLRVCTDAHVLTHSTGQKHVNMTLTSTFRLLSIFTVAGLKYNCIGSTKQHHMPGPKATQDNTACLSLN